MAETRNQREPGTPAGAGRRRLLRTPVLFLAWLLACKAVLVARAGVAPSLAWLSYLGPDLLLGSLVALPLTLLLARGTRGLRVVACLLFTTAAVLQYVAAAYQWKTGGILELSLLTFALRNQGELGGAIGSEIRWYDWILLVLPVVALALRPWRVAPPRTLGPTVIALVALLAAGFGADRLHADAGTARRQLTIPLLRPLLPLSAASTRAIAADWRDYLPPPGTRREEWKARPPDAPRPNVIFLVVEALRASATTPYPPHLATTPFLAELAKRALVFDGAHALVPHTTKSLLAIHTGYPPELHKEITEPGRLPEAPLAALLAELGYRTAFFQSATEFFENRRLLVESFGFEEFYAAESIARAGFDRSNYLGVEDRALVAPVLRWVAREPGRPFFLGLLTVTSHHNYTRPQSWPSRDFANAPTPPAAKAFHDYLDVVSYADDVLRELFAGLEQQGHLEDTVIFVLGDHGEAFGEHGQHMHDEVLWEEGTHIPLLVVGPERWLGPPRRIGGLRQVIDLVPTVADLLGVPGAREARHPALGVSLLADPPASRPLWLSTHYEHRRLGLLRDGKKHLYDHLFDRLEVYDLVADPDERRPLPESQEAAAGHPVVLEMRRWRSAVMDWYRAADAARAAAAEVTPDLPAPVVARFGSELRLVGSLVPDVVRVGHLLELQLVLEILAPVDGERQLVVGARQLGRSRELAFFRGEDRIDLGGKAPGSRVFVRRKLEIAPQRLAYGTTGLELGIADAAGRLLPAETESGSSATPSGSLVPFAEVQVLPIAR